MLIDVSKIGNGEMIDVKGRRSLGIRGNVKDRNQYHGKKCAILRLWGWIQKEELWKSCKNQ